MSVAASLGSPSIIASALKGIASRHDPVSLSPRTSEAIVLWIALVCCSGRKIIEDMRYDVLFDYLSGMYYQAGTIAFNYFQFGAVRRGLGGTIAFLLDHDLPVATIKFQFLNAALLAAGLCWLYRRSQVGFVTRLSCAVVLIGMMLRWGEDPGRTDMAVIALLSFAMIALTRARLALATTFVCVGLFIHESSFMFGLPLLAAGVLRLGGPRSFGARAWVATGAVFVVTMALYLAMPHLPHLDRVAMVDLVHARMPPYKEVDWAIYFALSGFRGVKMAICQNVTDPTYWTHPVGGALAIAAAYLACSGRVRRDALTIALAALPGFVLLCVIANDIARWTLFACANVWLLQVALPRYAVSIGAANEGAVTSLPDVRPILKLICAVIFSVSINPRAAPTVEYPIYSGDPVFERLVRKYSDERTPSVEDAFVECDPFWLEILGTAPVGAR
jgi:hypothetical protein